MLNHAVKAPLNPNRPERKQSMTINIICIGKLKEKYWQDACAEYIKRLGSYCRINIIELKEARLPKSASPADEQNVITREGEEILSRIGDRDYVVAMDIGGKSYSSPAFSRFIAEKSALGRNLDFIIGGSLGLSDAVRRRADSRISFSEMTFPHQMFRVMLLEQIYRAYKIENNETYHK